MPPLANHNGVEFQLAVFIIFTCFWAVSYTQEVIFRDDFLRSFICMRCMKILVWWRNILPLQV